MGKYYPPDGYIKDENSGLYYHSANCTLDDGNTVNIVTWFNDDTGEYNRIQYPLDEKGNPNYDLGVSLDLNNQEEATQTTQTTQEPEEPLEYAKEAQEIPQNQEGKTTPPNNPKSKKTLFIILGAVILVGVIVALLFVFLGGDDEESSNTSASTQATTQNTKDTQEAKEETQSQTQVEELREATANEKEIAQNYVKAAYKMTNYKSGDYDFSADDLSKIEAMITADDIENMEVSLISATVEGSSDSAKGIIYRTLEGFAYDPMYFEFNTVSSRISVEFSTMSDGADSATATFEQRDQYGDYVASHAIDNDYDTAWVVGDDNINGESITIDLGSEKEVYGILIMNGYWKSSTTLSNNGFVTEFEVRAGDYTTAQSGSKSSYLSSVKSQNAYSNIIPIPAIKTDSVTVEIKGHVDGSKYDDICISEIVVLTK